MADRIQPGAYVRVARGMYAGTQGRVARIESVSVSGPYAIVDVGEAQLIAVYVSALELVGVVPTVEQERDCLRAERDEAAAERDRLRRELEAWRDNAMNHALTGDLYAALSVADRLDAILRGES